LSKLSLPPFVLGADLKLHDKIYPLVQLALTPSSNGLRFGHFGAATLDEKVTTTDLPLIRYIAEMCSIDPNRRTPVKNYTMLMEAISQSKQSLFDEFLRMGASTKIPSANGCIPAMHFSVRVTLSDTQLHVA